ncbi:MAG: apolipoprotein N-acyltransferase [Desulfatibacillaceae bacterium]
MNGRNQAPDSTKTDTDSSSSTPGKILPWLGLVAAALILRAGFAPVSSTVAALAGWALFFACLARVGRPFFAGLLFHTVLSLSVSSFLFTAMLEHYGLGWPVSAAFWIVAAGIVPSLAHAVFSWLAHKPVRELAGSPPGARALALALFVAAWFTLAHFVRVVLSLEQGWGHMGSVFHSHATALSWAALLGADGLVFGLLFGAVLAWLAAGEAFSRRWGRAGLFALVLVVMGFASYATGVSRLQGTVQGTELDVAIVHPRIEQEQRWREDTRAANLAEYEALSLAAFENGGGPARLIVWPETALTHAYESNDAARAVVENVCRENSAWLLFGAPFYTGAGEGRRFFNSAYLCSPDGRVVARYDKNHLLPFAEKSVFGLRASTGRFNAPYSAGESSVLLPLGVPGSGQAPIPVGVAVCFEIGISFHVSRMATRGMRLLVNLSNDAWFGDSSESGQQLALLTLRCAEHGVPGIRATGYGVVATVDKWGRMRRSTGIDEATVLRDSLVVPPPDRTVATLFPHWFVLLCGAVVAGGFLGNRYRKRD